MKYFILAFLSQIFSYTFGLKCLSRIISSLDITKLNLKRSYPFLNEIIHHCERMLGIGSGGGVGTSGEIYLFERIKPNLGDEIVIFDVGANCGMYSAKILSFFSDTHIKLHCFEPSAATFNKLCCNPVLRDTSHTRIFLNNFALGSQIEMRRLFSDAQGSGIASLTQRRLDHFNIFMNLDEEVKVSTLDAYAEEYGISTIDFLKVDVEGHELDVFAGAKQLLEVGKILNIQFEFGGCNIDTRTYFQDFWYLLTPLGYHIYRVTPTGWLCPIPEYSEHLERFITTNFLASFKDYL